MNTRLVIAGLALPLWLVGCAVAPSGPSMMALPGSGRSFDQFQRDDAQCRQYALAQIGGEAATQSANDDAVRGAVLGTAIGALAGAALGGRDGSSAGAGAGLIIGSTSGLGMGQNRAYGSQRQYDNAYIQCMYAQGHKVPVPAGYSRSWTEPSPSVPPPSSAARAPVPPGTPVPPPPGAMPR